MNERIRELSNAAWTWAEQQEYTDPAKEFSDILEQKFAELIVQECADICNKIYFDRFPDAEDFERSEEGDAIKQHFGIR
jgi:hypothetical protein